MRLALVFIALILCGFSAAESIVMPSAGSLVPNVTTAVVAEEEVVAGDTITMETTVVSMEGTNVSMEVN